MVKQNSGGLFTYKPYLYGDGERIFAVTTTEDPEYGHVCEAYTEESAKAIVAALNRAAETVRITSIDTSRRAVRWWKTNPRIGPNRLAPGDRASLARTKTEAPLSW
jgi:hypothetical protein